MRRIAAVLAIGALSATGLLAPAVAAQPHAAAQVVGVTVGQDRAQIAVRDGHVTLSGERSWPVGLRAPADGRLSAAAWRRMAAGALVRMGAPAEVAESYAGGYGPAMQATQPAGDLDGDGLADVLLTVWQFTPEGGSLLVRALRGSDGSPLWAHTYDGFAIARPAKVGANATSGVLVVATAWDDVGLLLAGASRSTTSLHAIGGDGSQLWTREFEGSAARTMGGTLVRGIVTNVELFDATGAETTDALVTQLDLVVAPGVWRATGTASVIRAHDGTTAATAQEQDEDHREPVAFAAGDLDGAAGDDIVFVVASDWEAERGRLSAVSSADGTQLWAQDGIQVDPWVFMSDPGDMTGDRHDEILLSSFAGRTMVLDGSTGDRLWTRRAQVAFPAGDSDGDGRTEVAITHMGYGSGDGVTHAMADARPAGPFPPILGGWVVVHGISMDMSSGLLPPGKVGVVTRVIDGDGAAVRSDRVLVDRPKGDHTSRLQFERIGDVDQDQVPDMFAAAVVADLERETFASDRRLISGRTGVTSWRPPLHTRPAGGAIDGHGDDIVATRGRRLQAHDGRSGRMLWTAPAKLVRGDSGVQAADLTGDGRAELLISSYRGTTVLDGRTGAVRWRVAAPRPEMEW